MWVVSERPEMPAVRKPVASATAAFTSVGDLPLKRSDSGCPLSKPQLRRKPYEPGYIRLPLKARCLADRPVPFRPTFVHRALLADVESTHNLAPHIRLMEVGYSEVTSR